MRMFSPQTLDEVLPTVWKVILLLERIALPDTSGITISQSSPCIDFGHDTYMSLLETSSWRIACLPGGRTTFWFVNHNTPIYEKGEEEFQDKLPIISCEDASHTSK